MLSTVVSVMLTILGIISLTTLPITEFPDIAPPCIQVHATYPGANAEVVARSVATPLEESVNGVEDMTYMTSTSSNDGSMSLNVYFKLGTDPDLAAVNVQNRVAKASNEIPAEVLQSGISTQKQQNSMIMVIALYSDDSLYDETFLQNYAKINLLPDLQRIHGVGQASVFGDKDYAMRIWLKPDRLEAYHLSTTDVLNAIRDQNIEAAPGSFGQQSAASFEYVLKYKGKLTQKTDYEDIIIRANADGSMVQLKDVARVQLGSYNYSANTMVSGKHGIGIALFQTPGSNVNDILSEAGKLIKTRAALFPTGMHSFTMYSAKEFLDASISQVIETLLEAFILVFLVVFLFLQDFRSTLIPAIAVPVAIIGTFFFMQLFGFTINLLTLFALVLAIGVVVDDAIVVVEAVHAKMERTGLSPRKATISSMNEISGAIISITLVMAAVFVPVGFMKGPVGVFYRQFAFTLAIAIIISAVNALTLSPALCALFLKNNFHAQGPEAPRGFKARFFQAFNTGFTNLTERYRRSLHFLIAHKWVALGGLALVSLATVWLIRTTPSGFIPTEDQGFVIYSVTMPPGTSLDRTDQAMKKIDALIQNDPAVERRVSVNGMNIMTNTNSASHAVAFIRLKPYDERGPVKDLSQIMAKFSAKAAEVKGASAFFFTMPTVQGFGNASGFEFLLQDRTGGSLDKLNLTAQDFIGKLMQRKEIAYAFTTFSTDNPQYMIRVDDAKAKQLGISISDLMRTIQVYYGSTFVSDFNRFGKYYRVIAQADIPYRAEPASMDNIYVKNTAGEMVPVNTVVSLQRVYGPETVTRNNLFNAVAINGIPKPGYSTGDAIHAIEETAAQYLPAGYTYEWTGMTREEINSGSQVIVIFILSLLFIYFLLAAQYESYLLPLAVILTIPLGIFGVFAFIDMAGIVNNIYVQVGLIMLIGLLAKNAILIVEFAVQRRRAGLSLVAAATGAARMRLRPILMTSLAFIAGLLPLVRATGASALGDRSIGTGAVGGMLTGVVLSVFVVPVLYIIFQHLQEKLRPVNKSEAKPASDLLGKKDFRELALNN